MSKEDKIIEILTSMQEDMKVMKADIDSLKNKNTNNQSHVEKKHHKLDDEGVRRQLEVVKKLSNLLTKEEADALAAAVGE